MGHNYGRVIIQNVSKSACQVEGVPRVAILDDSGKVIPSKTQGNVGVNACGERVERLSPQTRRFRGSMDRHSLRQL